MHKCPKCGQEYEGKFCPNCGEQWLEEKTCPKCGAKLGGSARFCNECGYSFVKTDEKPKSNFKEKLNTVWAWIKSHLKIVIPIAVALVLIIVLSCSIPACIANQTNGTYYKLSYSGELDKSTYFILKSGKWEDEDGESGTYKKDGEKIIFYIEFFGETEELCDGTLSNYVLKVNGDTYVSEKHKHSYSEWETTREATCISDGSQVRTCGCGVRETNVLPALGHSMSWVITKKATCIEEGSETYTCSRCGIEEETQSIEIIDHAFGDWQYDATSHWKVCTAGCGQKFYLEEHSGIESCTTCMYYYGSTIGLSFKLNAENTEYSVVDIGKATDTNIVIPAKFNGLSVTSIGWGAFIGCSGLTSITIPDSVTSIGEYAFSGCSGLTSITIGNGVTSIGECAFYNCSGLTSITIGNGVTSIGEGAFAYCSGLTSITIPDNVTTIDISAFEDCSGLTDINFNGTKEQWSAIEKGIFWNYNTGNYTVHCTDGDIAKADS